MWKFAISTATGLLSAACVDRKCSRGEKVAIGVAGAAMAVAALTVVETILKK